MPDTAISQTSAPAALGIVSEYRSPLIGQLVAARAKATKEIKTIIKDKKATIPNKNGENGYQYAYADLANVMDAVDDALAAQEIAIFQTLQERGGKPVLITTLAHSSDQWVSSELRVSSIDAGPQVFGSALTYARRYSVLAILGLAPDADDDGKAAQDRADQQARQKPQEHAKPIKRPMPTPQPAQALQRLPASLTSRRRYLSSTAMTAQCSGAGQSRRWSCWKASRRHGARSGWSDTRSSWPKSAGHVPITATGSKPPR
jgi:hypothetical protein